jgi:hypothetical protein
MPRQFHVIELTGSELRGGLTAELNTRIEEVVAPGAEVHFMQAVIDRHDRIFAFVLEYDKTDSRKTKA